MSSWYKLDVKNSPFQQLIAYNTLVMVMGVVFWKGGSWKVTKPIAIVRLKMEDAYILYNVIGFFLWRKITKTKRGGPFGLFKLQKNISKIL